MLYKLARMTLRPLSFALYRPKIIGADNVPMTGPLIIASNHRSFIDSFAIPLAAPRKVSFLAKDEYWTGTGVKGTVRRQIFEGMGAIPVNRHSSRAAQESLDAALVVLKAGGAFGIYPEGTRSRDGRLYRGRTGVAWLALEANAPIVPVAVRGTQDVMPIGASRPRLASVSVEFGRPIEVAQRYAGVPQGRARREVTDEVMDAIAAMSDQERAPEYNPLPPESGSPVI